jgi:hypothetical protein
MTLAIVSQGQKVYEAPTELRKHHVGAVNYAADVVREYDRRLQAYIPLRD